MDGTRHGNAGRGTRGVTVAAPAGGGLPADTTLRFGGRLAFALPELCLALFFAAFNSWLLYYLVNVVALPPLLAGVAFLFGRLFDAVLDPVIGRWSDRRRAKHGRMGPIRWALVPAALLYVGVWALPAVAGGTAATFTVAILAFMAFSWAYTLISIPRHALLPDLVPGYDARTRQVSLNMIVIFLAVIVAIAITPALVTGLAGTSELAATPAWAWVAVAVLFAAIGVASYVPFLRAIPDPRGGSSGEAGPFAAELRDLLRTPGYARVLGIFLLTVLGTLMVQAMVPFYLESYLGIPGPAQAPILGAILLLSILSFPVWSMIAARIGKAPALALGIAVYGVFLALVPVVPRDGMTPLFAFACAMSGLGVSAINLFPWAMLPDAVDMDAAAHGRPREGLVYAVFVFAQKTAGSIAVFWNGIILAVFGHRAGQAVQSDETVQAFVWMTGPIPLVVLAGAFVLCLRYPVTREAQRHAREKGTGARRADRTRPA